MRRGNLSLFSSRANAAVMQDERREIASLPPQQDAPALIDPMMLSTMQQAALMQMTEGHVKRALIRELLSDAQAKPGTADYHALAELNFCERKPGKRYHDLTWQGRIAAGALQQKLCIRFGIHLLIEGSLCGHEVRFSCPCGQWSTMQRRSTNAHSNARRYFSRHIETAEGMDKLTSALKPPVKVMER